MTIFATLRSRWRAARLLAVAALAVGQPVMAAAGCPMEGAAGSHVMEHMPAGHGPGQGSGGPHAPHRAVVTISACCIPAVLLATPFTDAASILGVPAPAGLDRVVVRVFRTETQPRLLPFAIAPPVLA